MAELKSTHCLPTYYQEFIHTSKYARWLESEGRRETWVETVDRYCDFFASHLAKWTRYTPSPDEMNEVRNAILRLEVMPSMRALMTAGPALELDNIAGYNCSYIQIDDQFKFAETLYILMCGTGVGFSCERQFITHLPVVPRALLAKAKPEDQPLIVVQDSKLGWAEALNELIDHLYRGVVPTWDVSLVRPAGSRLRTFGGRASGPDPLVGLFRYIIAKFKHAAADSPEPRKLTSEEVHHIICKIAQIVVVGGVRRCERASSLVFARRGLVQIKDIEVGDEVMTMSGYKHVTNKFDQGKQQLSRIITEDGYFDCTSNHRMAVETGKYTYEWKEAQEFKPDDRLVDFTHSVNVHYGPIDGTETGLPAADDLTIPQLDAQMAAFIAWIQTRGTAIDNEVKIEVSCEGIAKEIIACLCRFGIDYIEAVFPSRKTPHFTVNCSSESLARYIRKHFRVVLVAPKVPECILHGSFPVRLSYIEALIDCNDMMCTAWPEFARQVQVLAKSCGIGAALKGNEVHFAFNSRVGLGAYLGKVIRVDANIGEDDTYDIEVEDAHEFFVDGYLSHNSALISLSNLSDERMRAAKSGQWWTTAPELALSNNSVCYTEKPEMGRFMHEWTSLYESKSGERGIFNRQACRAHVAKNAPRREHANVDFGCNPCSEIILLDRELCNLSEVIVRADDTPETLRRKVRIATIIGTWQSTLTNFKFVSPKWRENCERERLLGVSLTGIMDNMFMSGQLAKGTSVAFARAAKRRMDGTPVQASCFGGQSLPHFLEELKNVAISTNDTWALRHGVSPSVAITCVKPSGTVSQLVDSASGIHARHSQYYIRTVRGDAKDPLTKMMRDLGIPCEPDKMSTREGEAPTTYVFSFPIKAPEGCISRKDLSAIAHLDLSLLYDKHWCQHKASMTCNVREAEWMAVGAWVWEHFDEIAGKSFLPFNDDDHIYEQAPYQECDHATWAAAVQAMPKEIDWSRLRDYEKGTDHTTGSREYACTGDKCELV
jgi:hypothetical protein